MWNMWFDFETFTNLMIQSPERAFAYRDNCHKTTKTAEIWAITIDKISDDLVIGNNENSSILDNISEEKITNLVIEWEYDDFTEEETEPVTFTREDLENKLNSANITFQKNCKDDTLLKKCIENNLI